VPDPGRGWQGALDDCAGDPARPWALHDRLRVLADPGPWRAAGLVEAQDFDPAPACRAVRGHLPGLSVAGFDTALRAARPGLPV